MSLKTLPELKAFQGCQETRWQMLDGAIDKWDGSIKSATNGDNTITILEVIGEDFFTGKGVTAKRIDAALRSIGPNDVTVKINSPGGDYFDGVAIYNLLKSHKGKVTIQVMGLAASAASVIAMAGDVIQIAETGFLMVHNSWAVAVGNRHDMRKAADTMEPFDEAMANLYAKVSGVDMAQASQWMDDETWFNGNQAVEVGLADGLLPSDEVATDKGTQAKSCEIKATLRIENALRAQIPDMTRTERRALLSDMKGGKSRATASVMPRADDLTADFLKLAQTIKS